MCNERFLQSLKWSERNRAVSVLIWELGYVTSEKQAPSAIDFLSAMQSAISVERRLATKNNSSKALKDLLAKSITAYNQMVTIKRHRINGAKKALIYNMFWGCNSISIDLNSGCIIFSGSTFPDAVCNMLECQNSLWLWGCGRPPSSMTLLLATMILTGMNHQAGAMVQWVHTCFQPMFSTDVFNFRTSAWDPSKRFLGARIHLAHGQLEVCRQGDLERGPADNKGVVRALCQTGHSGPETTLIGYL